MDDRDEGPTGTLCAAAGECFGLRVCRSAAGYYIGTLDADGLPFSRESREYWDAAEHAQAALAAGNWTQRPAP